MKLIRLRRWFVHGLSLCLGFALWPGLAAVAQDSRPNVLFVILEDWGPFLHCYGEKEMFTPHLDQLAAEGRRYSYCFTSAPVCSSGRSSLMTGMSQYTTLSHQHRTAPPKPKLPAGVKSVPDLFREAGYFTALGCGYSPKIDLNFDFNQSESFLGKNWNKRKPGQPFFAHLTLIGTHRPWHPDPAHPIDPAKVTLPPWYPDTPLTRKDWALGLESAQRSDQLMGEIVARLKREGLYDNTAIVITADHGVALPRAKQFLYDDGLRIPLIIRWPARAKAGTVSEELVSNVDIVPTMLGLAGLPVPPTMQGHDLLAPGAQPRRYIFAGRDKMDSTHDAMRAVRSRDFKYILNLMPERAYCQFNDYKERSYPGLAVLNVLHLEGKLPSEQDAFMQPIKPAEELFDLRRDPHELHNLAQDPAQAAVLREMRAELDGWRKTVGDPGLSEQFRKGGWPAKYPTRSLAEWKQIVEQWENHLLRGAPAPTIIAPSEFGEGEGMVKPNKQKNRKQAE
ncbi:MAG: sulfatase [Verrucomicrobia bacterium]|nr:sulfatase [Verrucomicrobiota bacterium]